MMIGFEIFMKRLTEKVRNHRVNYSMEEAVERAVDEMHQRRSTCRFLRSQRAKALGGRIASIANSSTLNLSQSLKFK